MSPNSSTKNAKVQHAQPLHTMEFKVHLFLKVHHACLLFVVVRRGLVLGQTSAAHKKSGSLTKNGPFVLASLL